MDELFGVSMNLIAVVSVAATAGIFGLLAFFAVRNPVMFKQGLRNIPRRKTQTALIVFGLMLATVIITAAFSTGDTVASTATADIYDWLGEVDEYIEWDAENHPAPEAERRVAGQQLASLKAQFADDPDIEAFLGLSFERFPVVSKRTRLNEADALIVAFDPAELGVFTRGVTTTGGELVPTGNEIVVNEDLAEALDIRLGDELELIFRGTPAVVVVTGIAGRSLLTGAFDIGSTAQPGGAVNAAFLRSLTGRDDGVDRILISNAGNTRQGLERTDAVESRIEPTLVGTPYHLVTIKQSAISFAKLVSSFFTTFFVVFGLFGIAAGVLLIFLIFIMLAAERKPEMGMARAVGARRRHLVESFLAEGMGYDLGSAVVGVAVGMVVTLLMVALVNSTGDSGFGLNLRVTFTVRGLLVSFCLGVIATFLIISVASIRAARLNITAAIRDLPESRPVNPERATWFGYLRGLLNVMAAFGFFVGFMALGFRVSPVFSVVAMVGLVGPFLHVLRASNFYLPRDERRPGEGIPVWPFFTVLAIPFYAVALLLVRLTRERRPASVPAWIMVVGIAIPPLGIVLAALQDRERPIAWGSGMGAFGALLGVVLIDWGLDSNEAFQFSAGVSLVLLWAGTALRHFHVAERGSMTVVSALVLVYWYLPSGVWEPLIGELDGDFEMFFLSGITMVAAGTFIITYNLDVIIPIVAALGSRLGRFVPAVKTAAAYPLTARVRTGLTIAMIGLIMFALVTFSTINRNFERVFLGDDARGGWDVVVLTNRNNPIDDLTAVLAEAGVDTSPIRAAAQAYRTGFGELEFLNPGFDPGRDDPADAFLAYPVFGADQTWLLANDFTIKFRAAGYETDRQVWEAMAGGQRFALVDDQVLGRDGDFGGDGDLLSLDRTLEQGFTPFTITARNPSTGEETEMTVIGQIDDSAAVFFGAIMVSLPTLQAVYPDVPTQAWFVQLDGADSREYARTIEAALFQASAESLDKLLDDQRATSAAFLLLFQGFMGLGLVVGIAALGVIAFRAVVERRQQIGMLRAIGYRRSMVALSFLLESGLVALGGILMGLFMGVSFSWVLWTTGEIDDQAGSTAFSVPWLQLAIISGVALSASMAMTYFPARAASRVAVAEALRYE